MARKKEENILKTLAFCASPKEISFQCLYRTVINGVGYVDICGRESNIFTSFTGGLPMWDVVENDHEYSPREGNVRAMR